ncbi:uncharacterized protein SCHCODRAFT_02645469 [Schizophyllum commune H4-8]|uniref:uncharacterized protein n=1 Tax=Schizophyllum commune (strain H4-8 / FGSC 9210) TaxID=578458 RepID=UPI00215F1AEF|nr:uncharacterized protein SCHCODRAFT_02645469 [Schizophyllum commune H4-8]KAI5885218.1 hypothetical protein SCHCODRAFT_02645469 [Schizophyllum commune H4-8]
MFAHHPASINQTDVVRLAFAVAIARSKPPEQSYAGYVLHLQTLLPPASASSTSCECRRRTEEIEETVSSLRRQLQDEKIKNATLSRKLGNDPLSHPSTVTSVSIPLESIAPLSPSPLENYLQTRLSSSIEPATPNPRPPVPKHGLIDPWIAVEDAIIAIEEGYLLDGKDVVVTTSIRALETLSAEVLRQRRPTIAALQIAATLVSWALPRVLPILLAPSVSGAITTGYSTTSDDIAAAESFLKVFSAEILAPLIRSFLPESRLYLCDIFMPKEVPSTSSEPPPDIRPYMLSLVVTTLRLCDDTLRSCAFSTTRLRQPLKDSLALGILREMESVTQTPPSSELSTTFEPLARKEALWYLSSLACSIFALDPAPGKHESSDDLGAPDDLLTRKMTEILSNLLAASRRQRSQSRTQPPASHDVHYFDSVTTDLVLGVAEAFWMSRCKFDA